jgi:hypothetical protein
MRGQVKSCRKGSVDHRVAPRQDIFPDAKLLQRVRSCIAIGDVEAGTHNQCAPFYSAMQSNSVAQSLDLVNPLQAWMRIDP